MRSAWIPALALSLVLMVGVSSYGQHSYTPDEIVAGGQLYRANCLNCHGPAGDAIATAPLMNGKFKRGSSDEELIRLIRTGISGTSMTAAASLTEAQTGTIMGFLRSVATSAPASTAAVIDLPGGDTARGRSLFAGKGNCLSCHRVNGAGSQFGPDLTGIGNPPAALGRGARAGNPAAAGNAAVENRGAIPPIPAASNMGALQQSLLDPNAVVSNSNRYVQLSMKDGSLISAKLLNQDAFTVQIFDSKERLQSVLRSNIREAIFKSPMPSYRDRFSSQELADVVAYLTSLKGSTN